MATSENGYGFQRSGLKPDIFWSAIGSGFGKLGGITRIHGFVWTRSCSRVSLAPKTLFPSFVFFSLPHLPPLFARATQAILRRLYQRELKSFP